MVSAVDPPEVEPRSIGIGNPSCAAAPTSAPPPRSSSAEPTTLPSRSDGSTPQAGKYENNGAGPFESSNNATARFTNAYMSSTGDSEQTRLRTLQDSLTAAHQRIRYLTASEEESTAKDATLKVGLEQVRAELAESRGFVDLVDGSDTGDVIELLQRINSSVDELVFRAFETQAAGNPDFEGRISGTFAKGLMSAHGAFSSEHVTLAVMAYNHRKPLDEFLTEVFTSILLRALYDEVFTPFKIEQDYVASDTTEHQYRDARALGFVTQGEATSILLDRVRTSVPQSRSARWRSITYQALNVSPQQEQLFADSLALRVLSRLDACLKTVARKTTVSFLSFAPDLAKIVLEAIAWRHKTQTGFLSNDFEVIWCCEGRKALVTTALGLMQSKGVLSPGGEVTREYKILLDSDSILQE